MSLAKGQYDDDLMLYRQTRSWYHLEEELCKILEKESQLERVRVNAIPLVNTLGSRNAIKAQEDLQSMTALALRRREEQIAQTRVGHFGHS